MRGRWQNLYNRHDDDNGSVAAAVEFDDVVGSRLEEALLSSVGFADSNVGSSVIDAVETSHPPATNIAAKLRTNPPSTTADVHWNAQLTF